MTSIEPRNWRRNRLLELLTNRRSHSVMSFLLLSVVTWSLLTPDPFGVVRDSPLGWVGLLNDKFLHLTVFCGLAISIVSLALRTAGFLPITVVVALAAYSVAMELLQGFVPGRMCDPADALAKGCGIVCGMIVVHGWMSRSPAGPNTSRRTI